MKFYDEKKIKNMGNANKSPEVIEKIDKGYNKNNNIFK